MGLVWICVCSDEMSLETVESEIGTTMAVWVWTDALFSLLCFHFD
jgi:hypothetical protein